MNIPYLAFQVAESHGRLWAIHPERAQAMAEMFATSPQAFSQAFPPSERDVEDAPAGVELIPLSGVMSRAGMPCTESASTIDVSRALRSAMRDVQISAIVLDIDSPGGTVAGTADLAELIATVSKSKPVYAYVADMACSAAYWVASQATEIWASPNATAIGNIGVRAASVDVSTALEAAGVKVRHYVSGPYKAMGAEGQPIPPEHHDEFQRLVDTQAANFFGAVEKGRGLKDENLAAVTDGRWFTAAEAKQNGLIDKTGALADLFAKISSRQASPYARQLSPAARPAASAPTPHKPMSKLSEFFANLRGNQEAAQALGLPDAAASIDALEAEANAATPPTPEAHKPAPVVIPPEFEARIKAAESQASAYRESIALGAARSFAAQLVSDRRMHSADKADAEANYLDAARIDGGGQIALNDKGEIVEGESVARIRRSYASRPQHQHGSDTIPNGDPTETSATKSISEADRTRLLRMTPQGQKALAAKEKN